jgi:hypothetical protein
MNNIKTYNIISVILVLVGCIALQIIFLFVFHYSFKITVLLSALIIVIPIYFLYGYFYSKEATGKVDLFYAFKVFKDFTWKDKLEILIYLILGLITILYIHYLVGFIFVFLILRKIKPARAKFVPEKIIAEESRFEAKIWKWGTTIGIIFIIGLIIYLFFILR